MKSSRSRGEKNLQIFVKDYKIIIKESFLYAKTSGRKNVGRPRSRWLDEVNTDSRRMGM
jgi:hypothetical protein